jgi:hypothetical protein
MSTRDTRSTNGHRSALGASGAAAAIVLANAGDAGACPRCATGQEARRAVWRDEFVDHFAVTLTPFLIIGAISARLNRLGRMR